MRRTKALALVFVVAAAFTGCATTDNTNSANTNTSNSNNSNAAHREGVIETNANISENANRKDVPANTGVLTNDNGNENTSGVKSVNSNNRNANKNKN